ncbi:glycine cleavage system H protein [Oceanicella actignis]|uniref:Glycine cleavage system H protein n=1 Tax=Oceanicella actignis TaxID=1189325 RepID=A0A1M7TMR0_9RHOB|nr:glycine cleavage system H protein [Oceanicella actignis]SHN72051.1 glycine cleavage system H protein [Oceanicella actignis]
MIRFTEDHEWLELDGDVVTVGITEHAAEQLGDIVFIELPEVGQKIAPGDEVVTIESVKAASDIAAPLEGVVTEINEQIVENPALVNEDPMNAWFFRMKADDPSAIEEFMDEDAYKDMIA